MSDKTPQINDKVINIINNINLKSERLSITKFTEGDVEFNIKHEMNPEIMRYIRNPLPIEEIRKRTLARAKNWLGEEHEWALMAVRLKKSTEYIGMVCFSYESIENDTVEMGWRLGVEHHGKGYATEAAKCFLDHIKSEIKPHKVTAYCVAENTASSNIMKKLGMQQEGYLREFSKLRGKWFDEAVYGVILN